MNERVLEGVARLDGGLFELSLAAPARRAIVDAIASIPGVEDVAACERRALVWCAPELSRDALEAALLDALFARREAPSTTHTLDVVYDGADLVTVAERLGLDVHTVIALHAEREYEVLATGFAPGWAYLGPLDPRLAIARRASPRPRVEARSVAIADLRTGIYPFAGPGGWNLLGAVTDDFRPFDPTRGAALSLGDRVRFRPVEPRTVAAPVATRSPQPQSVVAHNGPRLVVESLGAPALVQDGGRIGAVRHGVARGGALWKGGLSRANRALSQPWNTAAIELYGAARLRLEGASRLDIAHDAARYTLREGESITLPRPVRARVAYLAIRGGVACTPELGGRGQLVRASLGGLDHARDRPIRSGDSIVCVGDGPPAYREQRAHTEPEDDACLDEGFVIALAPTRAAGDPARFDPRALERFCEGIHRISAASDRTGTRLDARVDRRGDDLGESAPMAPGAIEVPADGAPIVLGVDHPTVGGYPVIAVVRDEHLGALFARRPGARVRFALE
ncbi:MAG: carboxyltransferase domain-containing protein [Myxococcales bacterium]|nr:carboxyltransferase domain-containing protein [Myxococcales bacterium]